MNREQRRALAKQNKVDKKNSMFEQYKKAMSIITNAISEKINARLKETNLNHVQVNYVNTESLSGKTDMQYADFVAHDDKNDLDYLLSVIYFGNVQINKEQAVCIINTILKEQEGKEHKWVKSDKPYEDFYIDKAAEYIDKLEIEEVSDTNEQCISDNTDSSSQDS